MKEFFNWVMIMVFAGFVIRALIQMGLDKRNDDVSKNDKRKGYLINVAFILGVVVVNAMLGTVEI